MKHDINLQKYFDYLATPLEMLDGQSICPFISKFKDKIVTERTNDILLRLKYYLENYPADKKIVILYNEHITAQELDNFVQSFEKYAATKDLWIAFDHPTCYNTINNIKTNNDYYGLMLIQPLTELITKSKQILAETNYYSFWDNIYYKEIVEKRKNLK